MASEDNLWEDGGAVALFRPSYSPTWLNCEAALLDGRFYPDSAGIEAAVGTVFHDLMHEWLQTNKRPSYRLGHIAEVWQPDANRDEDEPFRVEINEDMFVFGQECLDYIKDLPGIRFFEQRVDISDITPIPGQGGTLDAGFVAPHILNIVDWKYGTGVKVFANGNTQLLLYAWGMFQRFDWMFDFQVIRLHIAQPRLEHWDVWEITRDQLIEFAEWAKARAYASWRRKNRTYTVGLKQCTWCRRRDDCRARAAHLEAIVDETFEVVPDPITTENAGQVMLPATLPLSMETTIARLSNAELSRILEWQKPIETWFKDIRKVLLQRAIEGEDVGNFYATEGRSNRHWARYERMVKKLSLLGIPEDEFYIRKRKSPNQMEAVVRSLGFTKKLAEKFVNRYAGKAPGKPTLVHLTDGRDPLDDPSEVFDEV